MSRDSSHVYAESAAPRPVVTIKPSSPVCPECHSSLNRVRRRLVDRLLSFFYPVHRYHCRSFVCNWEGNLRHTPALGRWEALQSYSDGRSATVYLADEQAATATPPKPPVAEPRQREGVTLPGFDSRPPKFSDPHARTDARTATNAPGRAKKRKKAGSR